MVQGNINAATARHLWKERCLLTASYDRHWQKARHEEPTICFHGAAPENCVGLYLWCRSRLGDNACGDKGFHEAVGKSVTSQSLSLALLLLTIQTSSVLSLAVSYNLSTRIQRTALIVWAAGGHSISPAHYDKKAFTTVLGDRCLHLAAALSVCSECAVTDCVN